MTVKGELEEYVIAESAKTGLSNAMVLYMLAAQGYEYKKANNTLAALTNTLQKEQYEISKK